MFFLKNKSETAKSNGLYASLEELFDQKKYLPYIKKYSHNAYVKSVIAHLKPAGCALLFSVLIKLIFSTINNLTEVIALVILLLILITKQKSPLFLIALSGGIGLFLNFVSKI